MDIPAGSLMKATGRDALWIFGTTKAARRRGDYFDAVGDYFSVKGTLPWMSRLEAPTRARKRPGSATQQWRASSK